jgi:glycosyltransferase involved in cell wall biosynthesis
VIVVSWNTREQLGACLVSLVAAVAELSGSAEIFVVDNASSDGSAALVESHFPGVKLIANDTNLGFARANNLALAQSSGDYVLLLNSDTELLPGALAHLLAFAAANARLGAAGPLLLNSDRSLQPSAQPMLTPRRPLPRQRAGPRPGRILLLRPCRSARAGLRLHLRHRLVSLYPGRKRRRPTGPSSIRPFWPASTPCLAMRRWRPACCRRCLAASCCPGSSIAWRAVSSRSGPTWRSSPRLSAPAMPTSSSTPRS